MIIKKKMIHEVTVIPVNEYTLYYLRIIFLTMFLYYKSGSFLTKKKT